MSDPAQRNGHSWNRKNLNNQTVTKKVTDNRRDAQYPESIN